MQLGGNKNGSFPFFPFLWAFRNKDIEVRDFLNQTFLSQCSSCLNSFDQIRQSGIKPDFVLVIGVNCSMLIKVNG